MPEEINRLVTDRLSDLLLTPDPLSSDNLYKEGVPQEKVKFVGNIMIDTLEANRKLASEINIKDIIKNNALNNSKKKSFNPFALLTLHRPSNVDEQKILEPIINFLIEEVANDLNIVWPLHPRTQKKLMEFGLFEKVLNSDRIILTHPLGYHDLLRLNMDAKMVLTDSGGIQEECTVLGTPCLTLRWNTERPVTLLQNGGVSILVGNNIENIRAEYYKTIRLKRKPVRPELWDGITAERCVKEIINAT